MTVLNSRRLCHVYHETYSVCTLLDVGGGGAEWAYRGGTHRAGQGGLMLMEPGELHPTRRVFGTAERYAVFMISPEAMPALAGEAAPARGGPHLARACTDDADLFGLFAALHRSLESQATTLERQSRLAECVRRLLERHGEQRRPPRPGGGHPKVARGTPPARAADPGFHDQSRLGRHLKASLGVTPRQYARAASAAWPPQVRRPTGRLRADVRRRRTERGLRRHERLEAAWPP